MTYISTRLKREIIVNEIITVHYFEYTKDFIFEGEKHDFWEFLYVDRGNVLIKADDFTYGLTSGDVIFHKPQEFHALKSVGERPPNLVAVSFRCDSKSIDFFQDKIFKLDYAERSLITNIIREARTAFKTPLYLPYIEQVELAEDVDFGSQQLVLLYLELFLIKMIRNHSENDMDQQSEIIKFPIYPAYNSNRIHQILQYMEEHVCEQITVQDICSALSLSRSALQFLFKREMNCGIMNYFNQMKIERAKEMIRDGSMNFTEISYFLSYSSLQYFSKQFKRTTGMSPLRYSSLAKGVTKAFKPQNTPTHPLKN